MLPVFFSLKKSRPSEENVNATGKLRFWKSGSRIGAALTCNTLAFNAQRRASRAVDVARKRKSGSPILIRKSPEGVGLSQIGQKVFLEPEGLSIMSEALAARLSRTIRRSN